MKKLIFNRLVLSTLILFIVTFFCEVYVRVLVESPIFAFPTIRIAISCLAIALFYSWLFHFFKPIIQKVFNIIYVIAVTVGLFSEMCMYINIGFFMGLGNAEQGGKVTDYIFDVMKSLDWSYWILFVPLILGLVYYIFFEGKIIKMFKKIKGKKYTKPQKIFIGVLPLFIVGILLGIHYITIRSDKFQDPLQLDPNYAVWLYPSNSNMSVNNFGVIMYLYSDTKSMMKHTTEEDVAYLYPEASEGGVTPKEEVVEPDYKREINDAAWNELNNNTSDGTYKKLNNYFMNRPISQKNEMTGIFKGKNVIVMLMESVNEIAILNENDFPTLYKMYHEGISFTNNFTPRNNCSTGNNEMTVNTSLYTINNTCTANTYTKNVYPEAYMSMFKKIGYSTSAYHDYTQHYYYRGTYLPHMGADKYYGVDDLGMKWNPIYQEWPSDKVMFQQAKDKYMKNTPFAAFFVGVTTHRTYNQASEFGDKYTYLWKDKNYPIETKRYLSKMKELDLALEELLKELEEEGILDDTVIALFGDHYPYGLTDTQINAYLKENATYTVKSTSTTDHNVDRTPMIIYNSGLKEPVVVDKYTTIIDLLPTLFNLFDVEYDPRLYFGTDAFSKIHPDRAYFVDGSWQDKNASYYAPSARLTYFEGATKYDATALRNINADINQKQSMSASAIRSNYFKYLGEGLEKYAYLNKPKEEENKEETTEGQTE
ncbi:MAG: sulfatase-like hydrolase/transferase [Bacilli bacterium]|nr:sulfatase-like hydrolase/transferase [Bacilli bacterium]